VNIQSRWQGAEDDERHIEWTRDLFRAVSPHSTGGVYVNFISGDEGDERVRAAYDDEMYERLAAVKAEWDPENVFHLNQNIAPRSGTAE
jgi:FAD/FMN-containing dehydrogenase